MKHAKFFAVMIVLTLIFSSVAVAGSAEWNVDLPIARGWARATQGTRANSASTDYVQASLTSMGGGYTQVNAKVKCDSSGKYVTTSYLLNEGGGLKTLAFSTSEKYAGEQLALYVNNNIVSAVKVSAKGKFEY